MSSVLKQISQYNANTFPQKKNHYATLKDGQSPKVLMITCSDSRLCPQEFTGTEAGDLFIIRNAGNLMPEFNAESPSNEGLTLEYGVCALGVEEVVVCGHVSCGAMGGLQDTGALSALPLVQKGLENYKSCFEEEIGQCSAVPDLINWNVRNQLKQIMGYPFAAERVKAGTLKVSGLVYDFVNGESVYQCQVTKDGEVVDV